MCRQGDTVVGDQCRHPHMDHGSQLPGSQATTYYLCERTSPFTNALPSMDPCDLPPGVLTSLVFNFFVGFTSKRTLFRLQDSYLSLIEYRECTIVVLIVYILVIVLA